MRSAPSTSQNRIEEPSWCLTRFTSVTGTTKNRPIAKAKAITRIADPDAAGELLGVLLAQLCLRGDRQRLEADRERLDQRDHAAQDRHARELAQPRALAELELLDGDLTERALRGTLGGRLAHGDSPMLDAAHHHALEHGLAAQGRIPRGGQAGFPDRRFTHMNGACQNA